MNTEPINRCPKCQAPVPPEAPQGLCPKCLLAAVSTGTEAGQSAEGHSPPAPGTIAAAFPQLEIIDFIGQGGMGLVYKARQAKLDRFVALKLLPRTGTSDPAVGERFNREARVLARLSHPNIVAVHDFGQTTDFFYLLMEFVDGVNLRQAMRAGRFTPAQALALVPRICDALQYAHEEGVLHRDIKPENLLLDTRGRVKIADFGIAKLLGDTAKDITLTGSGQSIGTPHYMAPEQFEHPQDVDQRADIYSLGVVFYEMLTGELPLGRFAPPSEKSAVDARVDEIVMRTLERERERRFQSAGEVKTRVENITANPRSTVKLDEAGMAAASGSPQPPKPWSRRAVAATVLVALSLFELFLVVVSKGRVRGGGSLLLFLFMGLPALAGTLHGRKAVAEIRATRGQWRGAGLALFSAAAWPLLLLDAILFGILMSFAWMLERRILHVNGAGIRVLAAIAGVLGILTLNLIFIRHGRKQWRRNEPLVPIGPMRDWVKRAPRWRLWLSGVAVLVLCLMLPLGFRSIGPAAEEPSEANQIQEPNPPPGYEIPPGGSPLNENRLFSAEVSVPAGYVLTLTPTWSSNQVALRPSDPGSAAYLMAPRGQGVRGSLTWRLLGNTTLADGAPLEFSLGPSIDFEALHKSFNLVPPEPISVEWASTPGQLWPPRNGHTKFLLIKGVSSDPGQDGRPSVEWGVGIEARLDPVPAAYLEGLKQAKVGLGSNWLSTFENKPVSLPDASNAESPSDTP